jgi:hypothetical protein
MTRAKRAMSKTKLQKTLRQSPVSLTFDCIYDQFQALDSRKSVNPDSRASVYTGVRKCPRSQIHRRQLAGVRLHTVRHAPSETQTISRKKSFGRARALRYKRCPLAYCHCLPRLRKQQSFRLYPRHEPDPQPVPTKK